MSTHVAETINPPDKASKPNFAVTPNLHYIIHIYASCTWLQQLQQVVTATKLRQNTFFRELRCMTKIEKKDPLIAVLWLETPTGAEYNELQKNFVLAMAQHQ